MNWHTIFDLDKTTWKLHWKARPALPVPAGSEAGAKICKGKRYTQVKYKGKLYPVHRVVWEMCKGPLLPTQLLDHMDGDTSNNCIDNLRIASTAENQWNAKKRTDNTTGVKGLTIRYENGIGYWYAQIQAIGKMHRKQFTMTVDNKVKAEQWLRAKREELHKDFAHHGV